MYHWHSNQNVWNGGLIPVEDNGPQPTPTPIIVGNRYMIEYNIYIYVLN